MIDERTVRKNGSTASTRIKPERMLFWRSETIDRTNFDWSWSKVTVVPGGIRVFAAIEDEGPPFSIGIGPQLERCANDGVFGGELEIEVDVIDEPGGDFVL